MNKTGFLFLLLIYFGQWNSPALSQELKVNGQFFTLDEKPFDMWGVRVASASQTKEFTKSLITSLDDYKESGINCISVFLQGSSGGYSDPFGDNGKTIDKKHLKRLRQIIKACTKKDIVVIVGIFYQRTIRDPEIGNLKSEEAIRNAVLTVTEKLKPFKNIIINIANEQNSSYYKGYKPFNFNDPDNIISLCKEIKQTDPNRIVGAGGYHDSSNVVIGKSEYVDVLLFDTFSGDIEKGHDSGWHYNYFKAEGVPEKPIVNVEIFGGWTGQFTPQGVYTPEGKEIHWKEIEAAKKQPGLYVHFHSNTWFQGAGQDFRNRFDLGGMGALDDPGVRWYFEKIMEGNE
ncbi:MAG: cellulase family glycosylhydrolase [Mariniphaga sp.]|nr:cellulase family glycosylhydrolase [Mariniphaga sp.]